MTARRTLAIAALFAAGCSSPSSTAPAGSATPSVLTVTGAWIATANGLGVPGDRVAFDCPPGGKAATVWGDGTYTADSSVCTAAVHAGLIGFANGGKVTVEIAAGLGSYSGSTKNGVTTRSYGSWSQSFVFPKAGWLSGIIGTPEASPAPSPAVPVWMWSPVNVPTPIPTPAIGEIREVECTGSEWGSVWGTDVYTSDSEPCKAAVHAGVLKPGVPGKVTIEYVAGEPSYAGTTRNGITTTSWQSYPASFVFAGAKAPATRTLARAFGEAKLDRVLDRTFVGTGADTWEVTIYRDGTALVAKKGVRRRLNVVGKAAPLASDAGSVRVSITGTMYRYDGGAPTASPVSAQLVLRPSIRGVEVVEESRSLGLGQAGVELGADDE